jgi:hypothetical protein
MEARRFRRQFLSGMVAGVRVVWPILSVLLALMVALGIAIGLLEGWPLVDGVYFAFVSGLTIGYGDLVPKTLLSRTLAICIGFSGILLTGLVAAIGVQALTTALRETDKP